VRWVGVRRTKKRPTWALVTDLDTRVSEKRKALAEGGFNLIRGCACKTALGCPSVIFLLSIGIRATRLGSTKFTCIPTHRNASRRMV
jgi:hypothetical protein